MKKLSTEISESFVNEAKAGKFTEEKKHIIKMYQNAIGLNLATRNGEERILIDFGPRQELHLTHKVDIPTNYGGYSTNDGTCFAVKTSRGIKILEPSLQTEILELLKLTHDKSSKFKVLKDFVGVEVNDILFYTIGENKLIEFNVADIFDDMGIMALFAVKVPIDGSKENDFEIFLDEKEFKGKIFKK